MLRRALIGVSILAVVVTVGLIVSGVGGSAAAFGWVGFQAAIILVAIVAERGRYRPPSTTSEGWIQTEERFRDPTSGEWLEVEFNPGTGERRYVPTQSPKDPPTPTR
ncbi:MAG TPA: hypothetical protein VKT80_08505 [Chloroflexota bacterium]|nr:hypothetical protein [Chloroflexota bacterium]